MSENCETVQLKDVIVQKNGLISYKDFIIARLFDDVTLQDIKDLGVPNPPMKDSFKVKIIKCNYPTFWYANRIGEVFDVIIDFKDYGGEKTEMRPCYSLKNEDEMKTIYMIDIDDCEKV